MGFIKRLRTIDKFPWNFPGFVIGLIGIGYAIYVEQFREIKPEIVFDVLSNTQVLSVKEDLNKLDIIYDGQNIKEKKENLILLTIRISNEGNQSVRESDFYSKSAFGLRILEGRIAEKPLLIDASNDFLRDNLSVTYDSLNQIDINKLPFDINQSFTIKVLTICKENALPSIRPVGKITGITDDFVIRESFKGEQKQKKSFLENLTSGSFGIHVARFFYYLICMVAFGLFVGYPLSRISDYFEKRGKKRKIQKFREKTKIELSNRAEFIFNVYLSEREHYVNWLHKLISDEERLKDYLLYYKNRRMEKFLSDDSFEHRRTHNEAYLEQIGHLQYAYEIINRLIKEKFIIEDDGKVTVDQQFKNELQEFVYFIDIQ
jgi:hypothetical protein